MTLDRYTARALVDANLMSLREYVEKYAEASAKGTLAGWTQPLSLYSRRPFHSRRSRRTKALASKALAYCH
jgi:hypothetical protein